MLGGFRADDIAIHFEHALLAPRPDWLKQSAPRIEAISSHSIVEEAPLLAGLRDVEVEVTP